MMTMMMILMMTKAKMRRAYGRVCSRSCEVEDDLFDSNRYLVAKGLLRITMYVVCRTIDDRRMTRIGRLTPVLY